MHAQVKWERRVTSHVGVLWRYPLILRPAAEASNTEGTKPSKY